MMENQKFVEEFELSLLLEFKRSTCIQNSNVVYFHLPPMVISWDSVDKVDFASLRCRTILYFSLVLSSDLSHSEVVTVHDFADYLILLTPRPSLHQVHNYGLSPSCTGQMTWLKCWLNNSLIYSKISQLFPYTSQCSFFISCVATWCIFNFNVKSSCWCHFLFCYRPCPLFSTNRTSIFGLVSSPVICHTLSVLGFLLGLSVLTFILSERDFWLLRLYANYGELFACRMFGPTTAYTLSHHGQQ